MFRILLFIGFGSFLGGISRFLLSKFIQNYAITGFPFGTLVVNILGCFLFGLFYGISERYSSFNNELRMFLTVGFCGGFTTFSTFAGENMALLRDSNFIFFALYTGLSVFLGLVAVYAGNLIIKIL